MIDNEIPETIEQKRAAVTGWITTMSESGEVLNIDPALVKEVLSVAGANFDILNSDEALKNKLASYTNEARSGAMVAIWGDKYSSYKKWTKDWISQYEETLGRQLPKLGKAPKEGEADNRPKNSGMIQFFGELTAFASGELDLSNFKRYIEARMSNGKIWNQYPDIEDRKKHQVEIEVPTSNGEKIKPSSIPPEFPLAAWQYITK